MNALGNKLKSEETRRQQLDLILTMRNKMRYLTDKIRSDEIKPDTISKGVEELNALVSQSLVGLRGKISEEELALKRMELEMAEEKKRKDVAERQRIEEEETRRRRAELERKCMLENLEAMSIKSPPAASPEHNLQQLSEAQTRAQQERLDHELALRLAREGGTPMDALGFNGSGGSNQVSPLMLPRSAAVLQQRESQASKKHNLSKWKYSELRDTINTSCDIELLEACREEFHRRLKVYHEWKSRNAKLAKDTAVGDSEERAPQSIMQHALNGTLPGQRGSGTMRRPSDASGEERFFRIPFVRPSAVSGQKGWWFAHFQGQWIARQMELHPEKVPILLVAGKKRGPPILRRG